MKRFALFALAASISLSTGLHQPIAQPIQEIQVSQIAQEIVQPRPAARAGRDRIPTIPITCQSLRCANAWINQHSQKSGNSRSLAPGDIYRVESLVWHAVRAHGWTSQWPSWIFIQGRENGRWDPSDHEYYGRNDPCGLPQANPCYELSGSGYHCALAWTIEAVRCQAQWEIDYIGRKYGDPDTAAAHERRHHWY